ncbi:hypothetical protein PSYPI_48345, partial [Pseudomonas syringae pv. pisi str. 1704B]
IFTSHKIFRGSDLPATPPAGQVYPALEAARLLTKVPV